MKTENDNLKKLSMHPSDRIRLKWMHKQMIQSARDLRDIERKEMIRVQPRLDALEQEKMANIKKWLERYDILSIYNLAHIERTVWLRHQLRAIGLLRAFLNGTPYASVEGKNHDEGYSLRVYIIPLMIRLAYEKGLGRYRIKQNPQQAISHDTAMRFETAIKDWINA